MAEVARRNGGTSVLVWPSKYLRTTSTNNGTEQMESVLRRAARSKAGRRTKRSYHSAPNTKLPSPGRQ